MRKMIESYVLSVVCRFLLCSYYVFMDAAVEAMEMGGRAKESTRVGVQAYFRKGISIWSQQNSVCFFRKGNNVGGDTAAPFKAAADNGCSRVHKT